MSAPDSTELFERAMMLANGGRPDRALPLFDALIARHPDENQLYVNRAAALAALDRHGEALTSLEVVLLREPRNLALLVWKGALLQLAARLDEARAAYEAVLALAPEEPDALFNLATLAQRDKRFGEAEDFYRRSLAARPGQALARFNLAVLLQEQARFEEAVAAYREAMAEAEPPALRAAMEANLALCLLMMGRIEEGWPHYEARLDRDQPVYFPDRFSRPVWTGREDLTGKTLLVHSEQGQGDVFQFSRYLAPLAARGGKVVFSVAPRLIRLLKQAIPSVRYIAQDEKPPPADYHVMLMSLPLALRMPVLEAKTAYLKPEPALAAAWQERLGGWGFKIGINWRGDPRNPFAARDFPLAGLAPLATLPGVRLISLQQGAGLDQLRRLPAGMVVETLEGVDGGADGFVDTAAIMAALDLVITADTGIAHLAGALATPTWVALPQMPEWRWQYARGDSPWYPSLRLFRQRKAAEWGPVFAEMEAALKEKLSAR